MQKECIQADKAPSAIGPYSQAIKCGNLLITSGQIPVLENLTAVLAAGGATLDNVIKTTCFLDNMNDFSQFNDVYQEFFKHGAPARSCVAVDRLPKDVLVEIEAIAMV